MPRHCCAQGCHNSIVGRDTPSHTFPRDHKLRRLWIRAAQPSRPSWTPLKNDFICSEHFLDGDYVTSPAVLKSLGMPFKRQRLKPDAVPSVFSRKRKAERTSGAFEKRRRNEIIDQILQEQSTTGEACCTQAVHIEGLQCDAEQSSFQQITQAVSCERSAEACANSRQNNVSEAHHEICPELVHQQVSREPHASNAKDIPLKPLQADAAVQASLISRDWGTQVTIHGKSCGVQTNCFMPPRSSTPLPHWTDSSEEET